MIELPNYNKMLEENRYYEFFREHVFYFDPETIIKLMKTHNFHLLKFDTRMNKEYMIAVFEYKQYSEKRFKSKQKTINDKLKKMIKNQHLKNIAFWGASGGGISLISYADIKERKVKYIIDSDPNKKGFYAFGSGLRIVGPDVLLKDKLDAIVILSQTYENEIRDTLVNKYSFKGKIGSIKGIPHWVR